MDAMDAVDAASAALAGIPLSAVSRADAQAILVRLDRYRAQLREIDRRLLGRLLTSGTPAQFGARSWAEVLARRLRISPAEAQRRIAEAVTGDPSAA